MTVVCVDQRFAILACQNIVIIHNNDDGDDDHKNNIHKGNDKDNNDNKHIVYLKFKKDKISHLNR